MSINIVSRQDELAHLQSYLKDVDNEVTMILQNLQWDRKHLEEPVHQGTKSTIIPTKNIVLPRVPTTKQDIWTNTNLEKSESSTHMYVEDDINKLNMANKAFAAFVGQELNNRKAMVVCQYDSNHKVPRDKLSEHEKICQLKSQGYSDRDSLLPSPIDPDAATLIKLNAESIAEIINSASCDQSLFIRGVGCKGQQPLTLERLQTAYSADERRAVHDAVVRRAPACHDLSDLALMSKNGDGSKEGARAKTKLEILAELRDMRRRRTKYRVAPKTRNYSVVLRDVITTQMELYTQSQDNSTNQMHLKISEADNNGKAQDDNASNEKKTSSHHRSSYSNEGQASRSDRDRYNVSRHSRHDEVYKYKKRRHDDSDPSYNAVKQSRTKEYDRSTSSNTSQKERVKYDNKSARRDDGYSDFSRVHKERQSHYNDYRSQEKQRGERDYEHRRNSRTEGFLHGSKDLTKDRRQGDRKIDDSYNSYKRNYSSKERQDRNEYGSRKFGSNGKEVIDKQSTYEYKQTQDHAVKIKRERDSCDDNESEYSEGTSQNNDAHDSSFKKIKVENDLHIKKEEPYEDDSEEDCSTTSSDSYRGYKKVYSRHGESRSYKDNHKYEGRSKSSRNEGEGGRN